MKALLLFISKLDVFCIVKPHIYLNFSMEYLKIALDVFHCIYIFDFVFSAEQMCFRHWMSLILFKVDLLIGCHCGGQP